MATFTNQTKSAAPTWTKPNEIATSYGVINQVKAGLGWRMGQAQITMGGETDPVSGLAVYMGGLGVAITWTTLNES